MKTALLWIALAVPVAATDVPTGLSEEKVRALLAGEGMGLARPAEMSSYPGPKHVLDLAEELGLSGETRAAVESSRARMLQEAKRLGSEIVALERELDALFRSATATPERLHRLTSAIAAKEGTLREAHLRAHIETRALLTDAQVALYDRLRGHATKHPAHSRLREDRGRSGR